MTDKASLKEWLEKARPEYGQALERGERMSPRDIGRRIKERIDNRKMSEAAKVKVDS